jgi:perosamine synthetase
MPAISVVSIPLRAHYLVAEVLASGQLAQGPMVDRLERLVAGICQVECAVAVSSGTASLEAALHVLDVGPGDEVITSPFTFAATVNAIVGCGATAVFADIDLDRFTVNPEAVAAGIGSATGVLLPVHLYGHPADMTALNRLAVRHRLHVVEDAAQALGALVDGRAVGSFGVGSFSFYATKNVTTGEGGAVTTNDVDLAERLRCFRNQGMRTRYEYVEPGRNLRMTDLAAAVGVPQLETIAEINANRAFNATYLSDGLDGLEGLVVPTVASGCTHVWHQYTVRVTSDAPVGRDVLANRLAAAGVGSGVYYPKVVFDYDCFRDHPQVRRADVPNARQAAGEVLSLPVHPGLDVSDLNLIVDTVREVWGA